MTQLETTRQFSFRLPVTLVDRVEACLDRIRVTGLDVTRADVVRLLLTYALDTTDCSLEMLLKPRRTPKRKPKRTRS